MRDRLTEDKETRMAYEAADIMYREQLRTEAQERRQAAMTTLSQRLRWLRHQSGLTLAQVAVRAFISVSHLSDMERGTVLPSLPTLERIAQVYGLSIGESLVNVSLAKVDEL